MSVPNNSTGNPVYDVISDVTSTAAVIDEVAWETGGNLAAIVGNFVLSGVCMASQLILVFIAMGLAGDFSARTLIGVQAVCEIAKRTMSIYYATCLLTRKFVSSYNNNQTQGGQ